MQFVGHWASTSGRSPSDVDERWFIIEAETKAEAEKKLARHFYQDDCDPYDPEDYSFRDYCEAFLHGDTFGVADVYKPVVLG